ncbi:MAG TPA: HK97 family phage prohead protease [Trueperaceae bacterium]
MELKSVPTQFKATSKREIEGHAAVFGNRDSYGDIIQPGAFTRTLANDRGRIKVLWQHDPSNPIGKPLQMTEDDRGLHVTARIADTTLGRDAMALFEAEVVDELSIGYDAVVEEWDNDRGVRLLREIKLWEFSPVTWAANELAKITSVKQASDLDAVLDRLERIQWAKGRLESPRLRAKAEAAIANLTALLEGEPTTPNVAAPPGTPRASDAASDPVHAVIDELKALNTRLRAASIARDLRAFGETLTRG